MGLALVGLPQAWLFQIGFAVISPVIDLALLISTIATAIRVHDHGWAQTQSDVLRMAVYWVAQKDEAPMSGLTLICLVTKSSLI